MLHFSAEKIHELFNYEEFIVFLRKFLQTDCKVPTRQHYDIPGVSNAGGTLLTMPAWQVGQHTGVKIVSVFPENIDIPTINGIYVLISANNGEVLALLDGLALTVKRTAAVSGLASQILSHPEATSLLMIGTGKLCHELIEAHCTTRPIQKVWIWGRNNEKSRQKAASLTIKDVHIEAIEKHKEYFPKADIISTATLSKTALINGKQVKENVYLDLVGSYKKDSREADNACLQDAAIYVDTWQALEESGDLFIPLQQGLIQKEDIIADLTELCRKKSFQTKSSYHKTYFKSVGFAAPDLAAAVYLYHKMIKDG